VLAHDKADKIIENVIGTYSLPFALALNVKINGHDFVAPMVVEEPSVVAAASNAAKMIREGGGFRAEVDEPVMIGQVQLDEVPDTAAAADAVRKHEGELVAMGNAAVPGLVQRGGGVRGLEARDLGDGMLVVHLFIDCRDAMGANLVNTVAEAVSGRIQELSGGDMGLRNLSNLCDQRKVRVRARVPAAALASAEFAGEEVLDAVARASRFAERDPYRATTHNKGLMNGLDAVVMATGNDGFYINIYCRASPPFAASQSSCSMSVISKVKCSIHTSFARIPCLSSKGNISCNIIGNRNLQYFFDVRFRSYTGSN
jgi:hydroxymethylglutaryl-CoA reductase